MNIIDEKDKRLIAGYCRESTRDQAIDGYNLEGQEHRINQYIEFYNLLGGVEMFIEDGYSAKTLKRPKMNILMDRIKKNEIKAVIVQKLDRLTRRLKGLGEWIALTEKYNVCFVSIQEQFDTGTAMGRLMMNLIVMLAEWEQDTISERTKEGLHNGARQGRYVKGGLPPFGYKRDSNNDLVFKDGEDEIVREIFNLALNGSSTLEISQTIQCLEFMKKSGRKFNDNHIANILRNSIYYGQMKLGDEKYKINCVPLVNEKTFIKVQETRSLRSHKNVNEYLYRGLVKCSCGRVCIDSVTNKPHQRYLYYLCDSCKKRISEVKLNNYIFPLLIDRVSDKSLNDIKDDHKEKILELMNIKENVYSLYLNKKINADTFYSSLVEYERDLKRCNEEYDNLMISFNFFFFSKTQQEKVEFIRKYIYEIVVDMDIKIPVYIDFKEFSNHLKMIK